MGNIYRRQSLLPKQTTREQVKKRQRSVIMNFRATPEEKEIIDQRIKLSGLMRQDYFLQSSIHQKVVAYGNIKSFDEIKRQMKSIDEHLCSVLANGGGAGEVDEDKLELLRMILELLDSIYNDDREGEI
jgi:hypothetical protein